MIDLDSKEIQQQVSRQEQLQAEKEKLLQLAQEREEMEQAYTEIGFYHPVEE